MHRLKSSTSQHALSADGIPIPIHWVEELFKRLGAILGPRAADTFGSRDLALVKREWAEALAGFSADEVKRGLAATRTRKFAPNLGEFLHLCRPALDPEIGFIEAEKGLRSHADGIAFAWSHPAVYWAAVGMSFEVRSTPYAHVRKRWDAHLADQFAIGRWPAIPDPTAARIVYEESSSMRKFSELERDAVFEKLRQARLKLTGFATKAEQDAQLEAIGLGAEQP
ncbi:MAG TPA: replication protein P [Steroidobacteraceae bacterium]|nr:replication protein P [Steroidobacteraceae bacterium]